MSITKRVIKWRLWIVLVIVLVWAFLTPSQFQKGGISNALLAAIPVISLVLSYFYVFFLQDIPIQEKAIIPLILLPIVYLIMTIVTENTLDSIFDDYEFGVTRTKGTTFLVNAVYYSLITLPILGLTGIYSMVFPYNK